MLKFLVGGKRKAFTLIELMTTTLIMAIIICAAIPFAMKKDIKKRAVAGHIGVFECYYDKNGDLWQHVREKDGTSKTTKMTGGSCTFNPNAAYTRGAKNFHIVAIGGGGAGGTYNNQVDDQKFVDAIHEPIKNTDTLESSHLKLLQNHGKITFGNLSNAGGVNAWYWNGQTEREDKKCYRYYTTGCGNCGWNSFPYNTTKHCKCPNHFAEGVEFCETTSRVNKSNNDYVSIFNLGPRLCSVKEPGHWDTDLPETDIFEAINKYYAVAGSYKVDNRGDITYNIAAPSGIASCACLNDPVKTTDSTCMSGDNKVSAAGSAGDTYEYSTHSGLLRGAYIGNEYLTAKDSSVDTLGYKSTVTGFCDSKLNLAATSFTCGTTGDNNACSGESEKTAPQRGFPDYYYRGNDYYPYPIGSTKSTINGYKPWYHKITMHWLVNAEHKAQGSDSLKNYGGDTYLRLRTHSAQENHAVVPRGHHGNISTATTGLNPYKSAQEAISASFPGYISSTFVTEGAKNTSAKCTTLSNKYGGVLENIKYKINNYCSSGSGKCDPYPCGSTSNPKTCYKKDPGCSDTTDWEIFYSGYGSNDSSTTKAQPIASCGPTAICGLGCTGDASGNDYIETDSDYNCEHLNCCNNYEHGSKKFTVRYRTGELATKDGGVIKRNFQDQKHTLDCGEPFYVYRQIKNVPFERAFVASAGQNGAVKEASYPKIDEELTLTPGIGGTVKQTGNNVLANGQASIIKKANGQIILAAQGGAKGASNKLNDTWVGPCMMFVHRSNFDAANPGCLARHDVMRKPTYNALLMANAKFLESIKDGGDEYFPGLGGDGAYSNVFPDRFLLSQAIRDQVTLEIQIIGNDQSDPWTTKEGKYKVVGFDLFAYDTQNGKVREEFLGNDDYAKEFKRRYDLLQTASKNFQDRTNAKGRVPNFMQASDGNNGAIVIIW